MNFLDRTLHHFDLLWKTSMQLRAGGPPEGFLQRCTCRSRITAAVALLLGATLTHSLLLLGAIFPLCIMAAALSRLALGPYLRRTLILFAIYALPLALLGTLRIVTPGETFFSFGHVHLSRQGMLSAAFVGLRALSAISVMMLLLSSAGVRGLFQGLRELNFPEGVVAALQMALGHIHLLGRTAHAMVLALRSRQVTPLDLKRAYPAIATQGTVLFLKSLETSRQVHAAMLARGFRGRFPSPELPSPLSRRDLVLLVLSGAILLAGVIF